MRARLSLPARERDEACVAERLEALPGWRIETVQEVHDEAIAALDQLAQEPAMHRRHSDYCAYELFMLRGKR